MPVFGSAEVSQYKALMSRTGEIIGALAANFIVAGIVAKLQGTGAAAVSFAIGLVLLAIYFLIFRRKNEAVSPQPVHIENNPNISPNLTQTFNPTINIAVPTAPAPAPVALPQNRPKLMFRSWDTISRTLDDWESGFRVRNDGEAASDVRLPRFPDIGGPIRR